MTGAVSPPALRRSLVLSLLLAGVGVLTSACGATRADGYRWVDSVRPSAGLGPLRVRWRKPLVSTWGGPYLPVERAVPLLDVPANRVYVGSSSGQFLALKPSGQAVFHVDLGSAVGSTPVLDERGQLIYLGTEEGLVLALDAVSGAERWRQRVVGAVRRRPVVLRGAVYVATESDVVLALAESDGAVLWRHAREAPETMTISAHAGLALADGRLYAGYSDGTVVCLNPSDGAVMWELETSIDVEPEESRAPRFIDVDTTPVVIDDELWVASFAGGVYGIARASGSVRWRMPERTGVTAIVPYGDRVYLASGDDGVVALAREDRRVLWKRAFERGSLTEPVVSAGTLVVAEKGGPLVALDLDTGEEVSRVETGHGFSAPPAIAGGLGFALSNGGTLLAFAMAPPPKE